MSYTYLTLCIVTYIILAAFFLLNCYFNTHSALHIPIHALPKLWGLSFTFTLIVEAVSIVDSPTELVPVFAIFADWLSTFSTFPSELLLFIFFQCHQVCSYLLYHYFSSQLWSWCITHFSLFIFYTNWEWVHTSYI